MTSTGRLGILSSQLKESHVPRLYVMRKKVVDNPKPIRFNA
jgi:hypothetical protein